MSQVQGLSCPGAPGAGPGDGEWGCLETVGLERTGQECEQGEQSMRANSGRVGHGEQRECGCRLGGGYWLGVTGAEGRAE